MAPSDDLVPAGDVLCLFGGKKSNFVGSGRTSWYVPIETRTPDLSVDFRKATPSVDSISQGGRS